MSEYRPIHTFCFKMEACTYTCSQSPRRCSSPLLPLHTAPVWTTLLFFSSLLMLYLWLPIFLSFCSSSCFSIQKNLAQTLINLAQFSVSTKCGLAATLIPQCSALCLTRLPDHVSVPLRTQIVDKWKLCLYNINPETSTCHCNNPLLLQ